MVLAFFSAVYALGLVWALALGRRLGVACCCLAAYPLGWVLWVLMSLLPACLPLPFAPGALAALWCASLAGGSALFVLRGGHTGWQRKEWTFVVAHATVFVALAAALLHFDLSVWTHDSFVILSVGQAIASHGGIAHDVAPDLLSRGVFQVLVQAPSLLLGAPALWSAPLLLALHFAAFFGFLGARALDGAGRPSLRSAALVALTVLAMASHYWLVVQAVYVHENFATGLYLCLFAACFWLGEQEQETAWIAFAHLFLLGLAFQRVETPLVAMLFLGMAHSQSRQPQRLLSRWLLATALTLGAWALVLAVGWEPGNTPLRPEPHILGPQRAAFVAVAIACSAVLVRLLQLPPLARLRQLGPALLLAVIALALLGSIATTPRAARAASALLAHMTRRPAWEGLWYAFALLALLTPLLPRVPFHRIHTYGSAIYLGLMLLYVRGAHVGWTDSGNRALTHLVPLLFFFFLLAFGLRSAGGEPRSRAPVSPSPAGG
jgi:hypothetical protein